MLECAAASAAQTKLRATEGAQLRLKTYVMRHWPKSDSKIGIDIGGVLISKDTDSDEAFFSDDYLSASEVAGSILTIAYGFGCFGPENIYLISKCSETVEKKTREWLDYRYFWKETHLLPQNLIFCRRRSDKAIIAQDLDLQYFVDDRYSVLEHMTELPTIKKLFLFNPTPAEIPTAPPSNIFTVNHWFWINAFFQIAGDHTLPQYPLPPYWFFETPEGSQELAARFFDKPQEVRIIIRCSQPEEYSYIQVGSKYYFYTIDWTSREKTVLSQFITDRSPLTESQLIQSLLNQEETWFGWPEKDHPIWKQNRANGA